MSCLVSGISMRPLPVLYALACALVQNDRSRPPRTGMKMHCRKKLGPVSKRPLTKYSCLWGSACRKFAFWLFLLYHPSILNLSILLG
jgi:hypothetical protein